MHPGVLLIYIFYLFLNSGAVCETIFPPNSVTLFLYLFPYFLTRMHFFRSPSPLVCDFSLDIFLMTGVCDNLPLESRDLHRFLAATPWEALLLGFLLSLGVLFGNTSPYFVGFVGEKFGCLPQRDC